MKLIQGALPLFCSKGLLGVSIRDICKTVDVSNATINYHFQSKSHFINECANGYFKTIKNGIATQGTTSKESLLSFFTKYKNEFKFLSFISLSTTGGQSDYLNMALGQILRNEKYQMTKKDLYSIFMESILLEEENHSG